MRVLIFQPSADGHRLQFVRACAMAVMDLASEIVIAVTPEAPARDEFRIHLHDLADRLTVDASVAPITQTTPWRIGVERVASLRQAIARVQPDHVFVPYADGLAQLCGMARLTGRSPMRRGSRGLEIEGILMRGRFAYPNRGLREAAFARAWLAATALAPFHRLHFLDPIPYEAVMRRGGRLASRARLIPEPVEPMHAHDRDAARRKLNVPEGGRILGCPGWLDERKGVDRLVRAFAAAATALRDDDRLLLVGRVEPAIRRELDARADLLKRGRIIVQEGCVTDEHLHMAMSAADVVCTPYPHHIGSSGIIVRAATLGRMVLASNFGWVGMVTQRFGLGTTCDCTSDAALAHALPAALDAGAAFQPGESASRFSQFHTQANFFAHLSQGLRERAGAAPSSGLKSWQWVHQAVAPMADEQVESASQHS